MNIQAPKYVSPKQAAEDRARRIRIAVGFAAALPLVFLFLAWGYSDQAPAWLRDAIRTMDRAFGYPLIWLLTTLLG